MDMQCTLQWNEVFIGVCSHNKSLTFSDDGYTYMGPFSESLCYKGPHRYMDVRNMVWLQRGIMGNV